MTRTRVLAALLAGLTLAGIGTAASALGSDDPTAAAAPVTVVAQTSTTTPTSTPTRTPSAPRPTPPSPPTRRLPRRGAGRRRHGDEGRTGDRARTHGVEGRRPPRHPLTEVHVDVANGAVTRVDDDDRRDDQAGTAVTTAAADDRVDDKGGDR